MNTGFIEIEVFYTEIEAEIAKGRLAEYEIQAEITKDDCGGMMPNLQFSEGVRLLVAADDEEKARTVLESKFSKSKVTEQEFNADETWECSNCGEKLEIQFTDCWKCGNSRSLT